MKCNSSKTQKGWYFKQVTKFISLIQIMKLWINLMLQTMLIISDSMKIIISFSLAR